MLRVSDIVVECSRWTVCVVLGCFCFLRAVWHDFRVRVSRLLEGERLKVLIIALEACRRDEEWREINNKV